MTTNLFGKNTRSHEDINNLELNSRVKAFSKLRLQGSFLPLRNPVIFTEILQVAPGFQLWLVSSAVLYPSPILQLTDRADIYTQEIYVAYNSIPWNYA